MGPNSISLGLLHVSEWNPLFIFGESIKYVDRISGVLILFLDKFTTYSYVENLSTKGGGGKKSSKSCQRNSWMPPRVKSLGYQRLPSPRMGSGNSFLRHPSQIIFLKFFFLNYSVWYLETARSFRLWNKSVCMRNDSSSKNLLKLSTNQSTIHYFFDRQ